LRVADLGFCSVAGADVRTNQWFVPDFAAERGRDRDHGLEL
jgi:hypothetical protein